MGVVEHGLFIGIASQALVGGPEGVKTLDREIAVNPASDWPVNRI